MGPNGAGKTSLVDALAVAAGVWLVDVPDPILADSRRIILPNEVRLEVQSAGDRRRYQAHRPVKVSALGQVAGHNDVAWTRQIRENGSRTSNAEAREAFLGHAEAIAGLGILTPQQREKLGEMIPRAK